MLELLRLQVSGALPVRAAGPVELSPYDPQVRRKLLLCILFIASHVSQKPRLCPARADLDAI